MKLKVMIVDGLVEGVLSDDEAVQSGLEVTIVDFDREKDSREALYSHYKSDLQSIPFKIIHPTDEPQSNAGQEE